jgi:hypothetical protein
MRPAACVVALGALAAAACPPPVSAAPTEQARTFDVTAPAPSASKQPEARTAYRRLPFRWRGRRIPYYNAARANAAAVRRAVRAWNRSGVRVRFVATRRSRARLIIRYFNSSGCVPAGQTPVVWDPRSGRARRAEVLVSRPVPRVTACSHWAITLVTAHELGHVLGLDHETRRCALMNPVALNLAGQFCSPRPLPEWRWRCRILEPDDVRGAVRIYGGRAKRRPRPICDLLAAPAAPTGLRASDDGNGTLTARFRRPAPRKRPPHLALLPPDQRSVAIGRDRCPRSPSSFGGGFWRVPVGVTEQVSFAPDVSGRYCIAVWSVDATGRPSRPATAFVDFRQP